MKKDFSYTPSLIEVILDNTDDGIILFEGIKDQQGDIVDLEYVIINESAARLVGKDRDALIGNTLLQVFPSHRQEGLFLAYKDVLEGGKPYRNELRYSHDGLDNWFRITAINMDGKLLVNFNDITGYKEMIAQKTRTENLYRTLIKSLPHADVALIDDTYCPILIEGRPFRALALSVKVEEGDNLKEILSPESLSRLEPILKDCMESKSRRLELENEGHLYRVNFKPVRDENGVVNRVLMVSEDISIFKATQNDLRNKIYDLESANESLEQFAYVASHDLQEPLRKIRAFGDRLQTRYQDQLEETGRDYIDRMQNAAGRMQRLIDDLLKYSRIGRMQGDSHDVDMNELLADVKELLKERIDEAEAEVDVQQLPTIEANKQLMEQLFMNLLSNALKFRKENTPSRVKIWAEATLNSRQRTEYRFFIKDNGIGFDKKYLDRIFDIFQRLHGRNQYSGTGIGLAICRKIVDNFGGDIYADSSPGEGATFVIKLPEKQENLTYEQ